MNLLSAFGSVQVSKNTNLDMHLLFLLIPLIAFCLVGKFWKQLANINISIKNTIYKFMGFSLILMFCLTYFESLWTNTYQSVELFSSPMAMVNNLDSMIMLVFGLSLITKRFFLARSLVPTVVILCGIKIINNPGATLTTIEIISLLVLMVYSLIFIALNDKKISLHAFVWISLMNFIALAYVLGASTASHTLDTSAFSIKSLTNNIFYKGMGHWIQMMVFITSTLVAEIIIWMIIRYLFVTRSNKTLNAMTLFESIKVERFQMKVILRNLLRFNEAKLLAVEDGSTEVMNVEIEQNDDEVIKPVIQQHYEPVKVILPFAIYKTINTKGIRAPSSI